MTPYYNEEGITLYNADYHSVQHVPQCDVLVTDPPYYANGYTNKLAVLIASVKSAAVFGYPEELIGFCVTYSLIPAEWITWYPPNKPGNSGKPLPKCCECIAVFGATPGASRLFRERRDRNPNRAIQRGLDPNKSRMGDVWEFKSPAG